MRTDPPNQFCRNYSPSFSAAFWVWIFWSCKSPHSGPGKAESASLVDATLSTSITACITTAFLASHRIDCIPDGLMRLSISSRAPA